MSDPRLTTGLPGVDKVLKTLLPGDNIVWQVDSAADYAPFAEPCGLAGVASGKKVIYFRFATHAPLFPPTPGVEVLSLHPEMGFEQCVREIRQAVGEARSEGVFIFDCLSELAADWYSDRMLANFFRLICPYVYEVEGLACFAMLRNFHSLPCHATIGETTQILIDVYRHKERLYIHPIKALQRHSPTMYMLHVWDDDTFRPVTNSSTITDILKSVPIAGMRAGRSRLGVWGRSFQRAQFLHEELKRGKPVQDEINPLFERLLRMLVSRDERMLTLVQTCCSLEDVLTIWRRMIGTGLIGGKAAGMLVARAILRKSDPRWNNLLEEHDSFYVGSDVFYTYLVENGCWWLREKQKDPDTFLEGAEEARRRILTGTFPPDVQRDFADMLDYFGQCPIIVRSSSLLEDAFGNSFAGKYESVFCVNQGPREKRLDDFLSAVRTIYASSMSEKALRYRARRGILDRDELMSLLVQRVSGSLYGQLFFPQMGGVGLSFNPYVWNDQIDPEAGMVRIVFGLGTRAVNRCDDDYTRVIALNAPDKRPEADLDQVRRYSQRKTDVLDIAANQLVSMDFVDIAPDCPASIVELYATRDEDIERQFSESHRRSISSWTLTFDRLLGETPFVNDMRSMLSTLQQAYGCPVDTEFTLNFFEKDAYQINLVQCRPLQIAESEVAAELPATIREDRIIIEAQGAVVGPSRVSTVDRLIYVVPAIYGKLPINDRYAVARLIGRLMHANRPGQPEHVMLLGPGRWGTTTPSLGVPVAYAEINKVAFLAEIVTMHENLVPDVSLGTHFFNELVEADILYLAIFPGRPGNRLNEEFLQQMPNRLTQLLPEAAQRAEVLRVIEAADLPPGTRIVVNANNRNQKLVCYLEEAE